MALVSANQFQLTPDIAGAAGQGVGAFQAVQAGKQRQQLLGIQQSQLERQQFEDQATSVLDAAVKISNLPDNASKLNFARSRVADLDRRGVPSGSGDSREVLELMEAGRFDEANALIDSAVKAGVQTGRLKAPTKESQFTLGPGQTRFGAGGEVVAGVAPKDPTATTLERNLISAGLTPGSQEFQSAVLKATTKPTTIIGAGETEEVKALAKLRVQKFGDIQTSADKATALLDSLNQLDEIDVQTGAIEPAKAAIAAVVEGFGIDASGIADATTAQAFNAISGRLVNDVLNAATGPQTDQDADRARKTIASLGDTPGAAKFKNNSLRAIANRQVEQRDFIAGQLDQNKNLSQANKSWREFKRKTPSLSSVVKGTNGLPLFFFQFKESAKASRPGISDDDIIKAWRGAHAK